MAQSLGRLSHDFVTSDSYAVGETITVALNIRQFRTQSDVEFDNSTSAEGLQLDVHSPDSPIPYARRALPR